MRFCKIENNKVVNIIKADQSFIDNLLDMYIQSDEAKIGWEMVEGVLVDTTPLPTPKTFDELKAKKIKALHDKYQTQVDAIKASVPAYEAETWDAQKDEWIAWNADNTVLTPLVDTIATARGIDRLLLLNKIGIKVLAIFQLLGTQQGIEDQIKACTTKEELDAISI